MGTGAEPDKTILIPNATCGPARFGVGRREHLYLGQLITWNITLSQGKTTFNRPLLRSRIGGRCRSGDKIILALAFLDINFGVGTRKFLQLTTFTRLQTFALSTMISGEISLPQRGFKDNLA
jgi:hypothetical protein